MFGQPYMVARAVRVKERKLGGKVEFVGFRVGVGWRTYELRS